MLDNPEVKELEDKNDIVHDFENREKLEKLNDVLQKLPVKQREVFIMRQLDQLTYDEIALIKNKSVGALKANYFHALKKITEMMNDE